MASLRPERTSSTITGTNPKLQPTMESKASGVPFRATKLIIYCSLFLCPSPSQILVTSTCNNDNTGVQSSGLKVHAQKMFCFPGPAHRTSDQHCFGRDSELFPTSPHTLTDTMGVPDRKSPLPHGKTLTGSRAALLGQSGSTQSYGSKTVWYQWPSRKPLGSEDICRDTAVCGKTTHHGFPKVRLHLISPGSKRLSLLQHVGKACRGRGVSNENPTAKKLYPSSYSRLAPRSAFPPPLLSFPSHLWLAGTRPHQIYCTIPSRTHRAKPSKTTSAVSLSTGTGKENLGGQRLVCLCLVLPRSLTLRNRTVSPGFPHGGWCTLSCFFYPQGTGAHTS